MVKKEIDVDQYIDSLDDKTKKVFMELRHLAKTKLIEHKETMRYGFPVYDGIGKFGFAVREKNISLYFHHNKIAEKVEKYSGLLGKYNFSKDTLRYKQVDDIPLETIGEILEELF